MALAGDRRGYYGALGVERTASADDIRAAFRERAKLLHPDGRGPGGDEGRFQRLMEAYEALRDPQSRVRYDAESLASDRSESQGHWNGDKPDGDAQFGSAAAKAWGWAEALVRRLGGPVVALAIAGLALLASTVMLAVGSSRVADRDRQIDELRHWLQAANARPVPAQAPPQATALPSVYHGELLFPNGSTELDPATRTKLDAVTTELQHAISGLPSGSAWVVLVESAIDRAADRGGLLVDAWEVALLRVGVSAQYLVGHGIAADRVAVRFHAGALAPAGQSQAVAFELLCCGDGQGG